jgi:hypothetical protein
MFSDLADYFRRFGGLPAVMFSPYTLVAALITAVCWGDWRSSGWADAPLAMLPALLGFSLAAYALLLAFGDENFRAFLAEEHASQSRTDVPEDNVLLGISAIFLHFIVIQVVALLMAVVAHAHPLTTFGGIDATQNHYLHTLRNIFAAIGFFTFVLSLATALAAALDIFHSTRWYVLFKGAQSKHQPPRGGILK